jgi:uncharacterized membrane protein YhfC
MEARLPYLFVSVGMIVVGVLPILYWARSKSVAGSAFLFGMLGWIVTVAIKFAVAIPFNQPVARWLALSFSAGLGTVFYHIYVGSLTAVTECGILYLAIRFLPLRRYRFDKVIAFGIGFGAIEAILLGLRYGVMTMMLDLSDFARVPVGYSGIVERASTLLVHTCSCALIFYSIVAHRPLLFWVAYFAKGTVDGLASWLMLSRPAQDTLFWVGLYSSYLMMALLSAIALRWLDKRQREGFPGQTAEGDPVPTTSGGA